MFNRLRTVLDGSSSSHSYTRLGEPSSHRSLLTPSISSSSVSSLYREGGSPRGSKEWDEDGVDEEQGGRQGARHLSITIQNIHSDVPPSGLRGFWNVGGGSGGPPWMNTATSYAHTAMQSRGVFGWWGDNGVSSGGSGGVGGGKGGVLGVFSDCCSVIGVLGRMTRRVKILVMMVAFVAISVLLLGVRKSEHNESGSLEHLDWMDYPFVWGYEGGLRRLVPQENNTYEYPPLYHPPGWVENNTSPVEPEKGEEQEDEQVQGPAKKDPKYTTPESKPYNPYPEFDDGYVECSYDDDDDDEEDEKSSGLKKRLVKREKPVLRVFPGIPEGTPDPIFGSHQLMNLEHDVCFDRHGRLGPYGFGYKKNEGGLDVGLGSFLRETDEGGYGPGTMPQQKIDWRGVDWGKLQKKCYRKNKARFEAQPENEEFRRSEGGSDEKRPSDKIKRSAILIRTWNDYEYTANDIINIRSMISELALNTGGEFGVHILVHVKDDHIPIWSDTAAYQEVVRRSVPEEFWGITTLWNEAMIRLVYVDLPENNFRDLPVHGVYRSSFMPVQLFSQQHPEYDFFWNWEMDVRYTGHFYEFMTKISNWAKAQPRKYLWERSGRFYIPSVHGSWEDFSKMVEKQVPPHKTVWGPVPVSGVTIEKDDPRAPLQISHPDSASWGVAEDADLIAFNPLFDAEGTDWLLADDTTGYGYPARFSTRHGPPRRASLVSVSRISKKLATRMHNENAHYQHSAFTEMWPATAALHHGLKAVYVPHPVYVDRRWPLDILAQTFNNGVDGATGGRRESVFGGREHNFNGVTWYYNAEFAGRWYKKWVLGTSHVVGGAGEGDEGRTGRMCVRGVLLHPVKKVEDRR